MFEFPDPRVFVESARLVPGQQGLSAPDAPKSVSAKPPLFGRASVVHTVIPLGPTAHDDTLDHFNTQEGMPVQMVSAPSGIFVMNVFTTA